MGLCAPTIYFDKEKDMWQGKLMPNWKPNDVVLKKKEEKMLDDEKIIVDQLEKRLVELKKERNAWTNSCAYYGMKLHECLNEIENLEDVLEDIKTDENEE